MKFFIAALALSSLSAMAQIDACPRHQSLTGLSENFDITITPKLDISDEIYAEKGNTASFRSEISNSSHKLLLKKGVGIKISFSSDLSNEKSDDQESVENWVTTMGSVIIDGKEEKIGLYIDGQSSSTILDLEEVIGEKFSITCQLKENRSSEKTQITRSSGSEQ